MLLLIIRERVFSFIYPALLDRARIDHVTTIFRKHDISARHCSSTPDAHSTAGIDSRRLE